MQIHRCKIQGKRRATGTPPGRWIFYKHAHGLVLSDSKLWLDYIVFTEHFDWVSWMTMPIGRWTWRPTAQVPDPEGSKTIKNIRSTSLEYCNMWLISPQSKLQARFNRYDGSGASICVCYPCFCFPPRFCLSSGNSLRCSNYYHSWFTCFCFSARLFFSLFVFVSLTWVGLRRRIGGNKHEN